MVSGNHIIGADSGQTRGISNSFPDRIGVGRMSGITSLDQDQGRIEDDKELIRYITSFYK